MLKKSLSFLFDARRRLLLCAVLTVLLLAGIAFVSRQQIPVVAYKLALVLLAGLAGFWLDRTLFPYASPDGYLSDDWRRASESSRTNDADYPVVPEYRQAFVAAMIRQAGIVGAAMVSVCLGL